MDRSSLTYASFIVLISSFTVFILAIAMAIEDKPNAFLLQTLNCILLLVTLLVVVRATENTNDYRTMRPPQPYQEYMKIRQALWALEHNDESNQDEIIALQDKANELWSLLTADEQHEADVETADLWKR